MTLALAILGPTAAGKSELALRIASELGEPIISVDSMQAYRGMDIGTAKPTQADRARVPHHLVDIADPSTDLTVAEFQAQGRAVLDRVQCRGGRGVIVGGSGLHFRALVDPLELAPSERSVRAEIDALSDDEARRALIDADPGAAAVVDLSNPRRVQRALEILELSGDTPTHRSRSPAAAAVRAYEPEYPFVAVGLDPGDLLESRIRRRFAAMLDAGLMAEVQGLVGRLGRNASQAVGYKQLLPVAAGTTLLEEGTRHAIAATLRLAKRQRTFFRRDPRIRWIAWDDDPEVRYTRVQAQLAEDASWNS